MKKVMVVVFFSLVTTVIFAQRTPGINHRQHHQHARIHNGVQSGELNRREATRLRAEQRGIRRTERRAKADGTVTRQERRRIDRRQDMASRDIYRQKHDAQQKP